MRYCITPEYERHSALMAVIGDTGNENVALKGSEVKRLRDERGWSQGELAYHAGVDQSHISRIENGTTKDAKLSTAIALARVFGVTIDELAGSQMPRRYSAKTRPVERTAEEAMSEALALLRREREAAERAAKEAEAQRQRWLADEARAVEVPNKIVMVPIVSTVAGAGPGQVADVQFWPFIPNPGDLGHDLVAVRVQGSCLTPRLLDGDLAIIDKNGIPAANDIVAVQYEGETILRIYEGARLVSTNGHPPLPMNDAVHLEGVVISIVRRP